MKSLKTVTASGEIAEAAASQQIAPRDPRRDLLILQNPTGQTGQLFYNFGAEAVVDATLSLAPGERMQFDERCDVPGEAIHVAASNAGHRYVVMIGKHAAIE